MQNCIETHNAAFVIEFVQKDGKAQGLPLSHLLHYTFEPNSDLERSAGAPPERLCLSFSAHQVTILGRALEYMRGVIRSGQGCTIKVADSRFADFKRHEPFVEEITIVPVPL